jgi:NADH-quinone oxidoreductase subunit L
MLSDVSSWLVWLFPLISSLFVPLIARFSEKARNYFAVVISLVTAVLAFSLIPEVILGSAGPFDATAAWVPSAGITAGVFIDPLSVLFAVLVAFFGLIIAIYSQGYMKGEEGLTRYYLDWSSQTISFKCSSFGKWSVFALTR